MKTPGDEADIAEDESVEHWSNRIIRNRESNSYRPKHKAEKERKLAYGDEVG